MRHPAGAGVGTVSVGVRESTPEALAGRMRSMGRVFRVFSRSKRLAEEELGRNWPASFEPIHAEVCLALLAP